MIAHWLTHRPFDIFTPWCWRCRKDYGYRDRFRFR